MKSPSKQPIPEMAPTEGDMLVGLCLAGKVFISLGANHEPEFVGSSVTVHHTRP